MRCNLASVTLFPTLLLTAFSLAVAPARAQTFYPNNTTINTAITGDVIVGFANSTLTSPSSPTVNLTNGGSISGNVNNKLQIYNSSVFAMNGSSGNVPVINTLVQAFNNSVFNLGNGNINNAFIAYDNSTVNVTFGNINGQLIGIYSPTINISGGSIGSGLQANVNTTVNITGGSFSNGGTGDIITASDSSTVSLFGRLGVSFLSLNNNFTQYRLSGRLNDGTDLAGKTISVQNTLKTTVTANGIFITPTAVPEPGSVALLIGLATTGAGFLSRRRRQQAENAA